MLKYISKLLPIKSPVRSHINEREDYLKTILDSMGIESGANANGSWIKLPEGTMIIRHFKNATVSANVEYKDWWPFPLTFIGLPITQFSIYTQSTTGAYNVKKLTGTLATSGSEMATIIDVAQIYGFTMTSIGRWKN